MAIGNKRKCYVWLIVFLLDIDVLHGNVVRIDNSSTINYLGELGNSTKVDGENDSARKNILSGNKTATEADENSSTTPAINGTRDEERDNNMVFYQTEDKKRKSVTKPSSQLLLKSTSADAGALPTVGEGLDLAKASILPKRSSPSIVPSCIGNQITLKCAAEGNPAPDFTWYKGKQQVNKEKVAEFDLNIAPSLFVRASHLTLTPKKKEDFDDYECSASNTLGASQQSRHRIKLTDKGKGVCAQSWYENDKQKYNSIIIGTVASVGMLLAVLFIAGFVFYRLNKREADGYQSLEKSAKEEEASLDVDSVEAASTSNQREPSSSNKNIDNEEIQDDFNAQEIGRLSCLLAGDWEKLARLLGFHQHDVNVIREDSDKIESRCADMLNRFRRRNGSRETLAESVEELKDIETASAIRQKYYKFNPTQ